MPRILILGGTAEAADLARALAGLDVISSLAGRTQAPALPGQVRVGGFGGAEGLAEYLKTESIHKMVDATHPFAARISAHAQWASATTGIPRLALVRPMWNKRDGDRWVEVDTMDEAAACLPSLGKSALLTIGRYELRAFTKVFGVRKVIRSLTPESPLLDAEVVVGRPPFSVDDEIDLLKKHAIEVVVTKASGGDSTYAKIAAARALSLPVLMIRRPPPPAEPWVDSVAAAVDWVQG